MGDMKILVRAHVRIAPCTACQAHPENHKEQHRLARNSGRTTGCMLRKRHAGAAEVVGCGGAGQDNYLHSTTDVVYMHMLDPLDVGD